MWNSEDEGEFNPKRGCVGESADTRIGRLVFFFLFFFPSSFLPFFMSYWLREILIKTTTGIHPDSGHDPIPDLLPPSIPPLRLPI